MQAWRMGALGVILTGALTCAAFSGQPPTAANNLTSTRTLTYPVEAAPDGQVLIAQQPVATPYSADGVRLGVYQGHQQPAQLAQQYVKAEKEEQKRDIRRKLADLLNQEFEQHSQRQQKELEELEKQIARLRSTLRKRLEAKSTIIERRIDQLIQDAEGLGWNAPSSPHTGNLFYTPQAVPLEGPHP